MPPLDFILFDLDNTLYPRRSGLLAALPGEKYIFSNASRDHCLRVLTHLGVADFFVGIYDIIRLRWQPKPLPAVYRQVLTGVGRPAARGLMVDDLPANLEPARALGLRTVLVRDGEGEKRDGCLGGEVVVDTIHRLPEVLRRLLSPPRCGPASAGGG